MIQERQTRRALSSAFCICEAHYKSHEALLILSRAGNTTVLSYWNTLLSAIIPDKIGLIVLTGLKNLPGRRPLSSISITLTRRIDEPFFPALPCILALVDEMPKGLVGYFATHFFSYCVWWIDHGQICRFRPDGQTQTEAFASTLQDSMGKGSEGNKSDSFSLVFIPPGTEEVVIITTDVLSGIDHSKFGAYHVLWKQSEID